MEDNAEDNTVTHSEVLQDFKAVLTPFVHLSEPHQTTPRRSSRKPASSRFDRNITKEDDSKVLQKRSSSNDGDILLPSKRNPKKQKRGYASPEKYAHLDTLPDHLKDELDVLFCGINPGYKSAETGHHFSNPTNHFWKCLHKSGFTPERLLPEEDGTLPERFSLGLTNLVDRPTAEQTELSGVEQVAGVPSFLAKVVRFRPRIVCFVGLGIAKTVQTALFKQEGNKPAAATKIDPGLLCFKLVYPQMTDPMAVRETLFYAMPSTSGRVTQFQATDKEKIFADLRKQLEKVKQSTLDTGDIIAVSPSKAMSNS